MTMRRALHLAVAIAFLIWGATAGLARGHHDHGHHGHGQAHAHAAASLDAAAPDEPHGRAGADGHDCQHAHCHAASLIPQAACALLPRVARAGPVPGPQASLTSRAVPVHERPPRLATA